SFFSVGGVAESALARGTWTSTKDMRTPFVVLRCEGGLRCNRGRHHIRRADRAPGRCRAGEGLAWREGPQRPLRFIDLRYVLFWLPGGYFDVIASVEPSRGASEGK